MIETNNEEIFKRKRSPGELLQNKKKILLNSNRLAFIAMILISLHFLCCSVRHNVSYIDDLVTSKKAIVITEY